MLECQAFKMKVLRAKDRKGLTNELHGWQECRRLSMRNATASGDICVEMSTPGLAPRQQPGAAARG